MHGCMDVCMCVYVCMYVCMYVCIYIYIYNRSMTYKWISLPYYERRKQQSCLENRGYQCAQIPTTKAQVQLSNPTKGRCKVKTIS